MSDYGEKYTEKQLEKLEKQIEEVYKQAHDDIEKKMIDFNKKLINVKMPIWKGKLDSGEITQEEYDKWLTGQLFQSQQWQAKEEQLCNVLFHANSEAINILNGGKISVFAENANWTAYTLEHGVGINFGFGVYDSATVTRLIKDNPDLLPKWKINEKKDYIWNKKKVNSVITQGIVQGKKFDSIAKDLTDKLSAQNENLMKTHARTAMTAAQNAGRYQSLMNAKDMGIDVYKEWMTTLDGRTRDSHRHLDGERQKVGDKWHPFKFSNGCRYPGDPEGPPWEVYNCRCTLVGDLDDYPEEYERRDNIEGVPIKNMTYDEWYSAKQQYQEKVDKYGTLDQAKKDLEALKKKATEKDAYKVFSNIWQDDVTYADWEDKKGSIQAKLDYFDNQIDKWERRLINDLSDEMPGADDESRKVFAEDLVSVFKRYNSPYAAMKDPGMAELLVYFDESDFADLWIIYEDGLPFKQISKFTKLRSDLLEYQRNGAEYYKLLLDIREAEQRVWILTPKSLDSITFSGDAYTQARKDAAKWFTGKTYDEGDRYYSSWSEEVHQHATRAEKSAYYDYTDASGGFNRPLVGFKSPMYSGGSGWDAKYYVGPGKVDLDNEGKGEQIRNLTSFVEKSKLPDDVWVQTAQSFRTLEGTNGFLGIDYGSLVNMSTNDLRQFEGVTSEFPQFISGSINRGGGSYTPGEVRLNIYLPKGSEALYVLEDGAFGKAEHEIILQRGGTYRITKMYWGEDVEHFNKKILVVDMELITSLGYHKF